MARTRKAIVSPDQLLLDVDRIGEDARVATVVAIRPVVAPAPVAAVVLPPPEPIAQDEPAEPFSRWLIAQAPLKRIGLIGMLAAAAKADPRFPRSADPEAVRRHVSLLGADGDIHEAIDDAEREWMRV